MNSANLPPQERTLRKSVSFCLPNDGHIDDGDDDVIRVPDRLLARHERRSVSSAPLLSLPNTRRGATSQSLPAPIPPSVSKHEQRRLSLPTPLMKRTQSVPVGLTLANVLTKQRNDAILGGNSQSSGNGLRANRYSSSSLVKQRMVKRSEIEFNRVAAKVSEFCRRVETQLPAGQAPVEPEAADTYSQDQLMTTAQPTITHRGRRYRASISLSSTNSADNHSDKEIDGGKVTHSNHRTRDINANEPVPVKVGLATERQTKPETVVRRHNSSADDNVDDDELNDRISKWLNGVNNSVGQMSVNDLDDEDGGESQTTIATLTTKKGLGIR